MYTTAISIIKWHFHIPKPFTKLEAFTTSLSKGIVFKKIGILRRGGSHGSFPFISWFIFTTTHTQSSIALCWEAWILEPVQALAAALTCCVILCSVTSLSLHKCANSWADTFQLLKCVHFNWYISTTSMCLVHRKHLVRAQWYHHHQSRTPSKDCSGICIRSVWELSTLWDTTVVCEWVGRLQETLIFI